ncbi:VOC family protein [Alicyclobacillus macrosporangiidus]|uniref:Glyoxalase superfamily enzyme, possibly 3-demethylubiquinone-9 3-methyltransferase n=1 Tax=Alicyclobacillus macrosporangiidus TaxID=392015 RepID=A0A1I7KVJ1_9BACL|nr:VOC family protein [Alicyclobacillus macrosporangiidus]SFV01336.1 Glyoxalase superfamily enzyme, possibly 3-demethylubiquinone-9 3-methyltransferase [Alicyclobacillus macrosporangiidus]
MSKITTFLMFDGQAEEAMKFYTSLFKDSQINHIFHSEDGKILHATFTLKGQTMMCMDTSVKHDFTFTPSISLFVTCDTEGEIDALFERLSEGGQVLMPLAPSPISQKFGWVTDKFGVSWQLNLSQ